MNALLPIYCLKPDFGYFLTGLAFYEGEGKDAFQLQLVVGGPMVKKMLASKLEVKGTGTKLTLFIIHYKKVAKPFSAPFPFNLMVQHRQI